MRKSAWVEEIMAGILEKRGNRADYNFCTRRTNRKWRGGQKI